MLSYLDGATGQMLLAALAGGGAGVAVVLKMYGHRLMGVFSKQHRAKADEAQLQLLGDRVDKITAKQPDTDGSDDVPASS